jgi:uncharacterized protein YndB with AHSA1/START domain
MMQPATHVDHDTSTIRFERHFEASPEEVFDAWTSPELIRLWWDPSGQPLAACTVDLRPGGAFVFTSDSGHAPPFAGTYLEIARPSLLVFDAMNARGTVQLSGEPNKTRMVVTIRCSSREHLAQFLQIGVDVGTARTLDNLVALVGQRRA